MKLSFLLAVGTMLLLNVGMAQARDCELPFERLEAACAAQANPEAVSGVEKPRNVKDLIQDYQQKSRQSTELVAQAQEDYRNYVAKKR